MSKHTFSSTDERQVGYGPAYVISASNPDYLVGRLLTLIETLGFDEKREKATKDIFRQEAYKLLEGSTWIDGGLHNVIKEASKELEKIPAKGVSIPTNGPIPYVYDVDYVLSFEERN